MEMNQNPMGGDQNLTEEEKKKQEEQQAASANNNEAPASEGAPSQEGQQPQQ